MSPTDDHTAGDPAAAAAPSPPRGPDRPGRSIDRRTFLAGGLAFLAACGSDGESADGSTGSSTVSSSSSSTATTAAGSTSTSSTGTTLGSTATSANGDGARLDRLAGRLQGRLLRPGDDEYELAKRLYDPEFDPVMPAAVAQVAEAADVQRCVDFAASNGLAITARSGGHSYIGASTVEGGLVVDLRGLAEVRSLSPTTAAVGTGTRLMDLYYGLAATGQAVPAGTCPTVGVAGLTLGGGVGVTSRAWGLTCDNLIGADLVTADGALLSVSADEHPDLFWALRGGGGGTVGIATELRFATRDAVDITTFSLEWDGRDAAEVLPAWLAWVTEGPDELWSNCTYGQERDLVLRMVGAWVGDREGAEAEVDRLQSSVAAFPIDRSVRQRSLLDAMRFMAGCSSWEQPECRIDEGEGTGVLGRQAFAARSTYLDAAPDGQAIADLAAVFDRADQPAEAGAVVMLLDANQGAIGRVAADATAFPHRASLASVQFFGGWRSEDGPEATERWLDAVYDTVVPISTGGAYVNYADGALDDPDAAYYGNNAATLADIKRTWDPDRLFDVGQIIAT